MAACLMYGAAEAWLAVTMRGSLDNGVGVDISLGQYVSKAELNNRVG